LNELDDNSKNSLDQADINLGYHRVSIEESKFGGKFSALNQFNNNCQVISSNTQQIFRQNNNDESGINQ